MTKPLSDGEKQKLNAALRDIVLVEKGLYGPLLEAKNYKVPSTQASSPFGLNVSATLISSAGKMIDSAINANWEQTRAKVVVENARSIVDGHSAKEIISIAQDERKKATESAIAIYLDQLATARAALNELQEDVDNIVGKEAEQKKLVDKLLISKPIFSYETDFTKRPIISFTLANKGRVPVKKIFVEAKLQTPGRAVPWVNSSFNYEIPGGLEPKESQSLRLAPNMFSDWGNVPEEAVNGSVLTLKLVAFEDASGARIGSHGSRDESLESRRRALENAVKELEGKIVELRNNGV